MQEYASAHLRPIQRSAFNAGEISDESASPNPCAAVTRKIFKRWAVRGDALNGSRKSPRFGRREIVLANDWNQQRKIQRGNDLRSFLAERPPAKQSTRGVYVLHRRTGQINNRFCNYCEIRGNFRAAARKHDDEIAFAMLL